MRTKILAMFSVIGLCGAVALAQGGGGRQGGGRAGGEGGGTTILEQAPTDHSIAIPNEAVAQSQRLARQRLLWVDVAKREQPLGL